MISFKFFKKRKKRGTNKNSNDNSNKKDISYRHWEYFAVPKYKRIVLESWECPWPEGCLYFGTPGGQYREGIKDSEGLVIIKERQWGDDDWDGSWYSMTTYAVIPVGDEGRLTIVIDDNGKRTEIPMTVLRDFSPRGLVFSLHF